MTLGLVCDKCDALSPLGAITCADCGTSLGITREVSRTGSGPAPTSSSASPAHALRRCPACATEVPDGHRFCGNCGTQVDRPEPAAVLPSLGKEKSKGPKTQYFGVMQAPGRAKLILIKGEGLDGVSYVLSATEHLAGRLEGAILFPDDPLLSPRHANFFYREGHLHVRDESSRNGVFVRIAEPKRLPSGGVFSIGEQLLRVEACPAVSGPVCGPDGTYFYGSPRKPSKLQLIQMLAGGEPGLIIRGSGDMIAIGREGNDLNFPEDPFISGRHAQVQAVETQAGIRFQLTDLGSKNGTFLKVDKETALKHGDYVFIGRQLLRVEIT